MTKFLFIFFTSLLIISCSQKKDKINNKENSSNGSLSNNLPLTKNGNALSLEDEKFDEFLNAMIMYKLVATIKIEHEYKIQQVEKFVVGKHQIEIYKRDSFNIDWIKINSQKIYPNKLKTINPRVDGVSEDMFCQSIQNLRLFKFKGDEILFFELTPHPCNGLGCSVSDYLIYSTTKEKINLFGTFRVGDLDLYNFPIDSALNFVATEHNGAFHGTTQVQWISRIYSMNSNGIFELAKGKQGHEYFYSIETFPNDTTVNPKYSYSWF